MYISCFWMRFALCIWGVNLLTARCTRATTLYNQSKPRDRRDVIDDKSETRRNVPDRPSYNDTQTLLAHLMETYEFSQRPVLKQRDYITVTASMYLQSVEEFDEVTGLFSFVAGIEFEWTDEKMVWERTEYGGVPTLVVPYGNVWTPEIAMTNPSDYVDTLGKSWHRVRYYYNGRASWFPVDLFKSKCNVNVKYYPFDKQVCVVSFNALIYSNWELKLATGKDKIILAWFSEHSMWEIEKTGVVIISKTMNQISFIFHMKRKPAYVIVNVILPILFLSLLNVLVFVLVPESGERASFSITVLLAIAVFLTIVNDMLPRSSQPVPLISYKLMVDMIISSLVVVVMVINMRVYNRSDEAHPVPGWLRKIYRIVTCSCYSNRRGRVHNAEDDTNAAKPYIVSALDTNHALTNGNSKSRPASTNATSTRYNKNNMNEKEHVWIEQTMASVTDAQTDDVTDAGEVKITWAQISYVLDWIAFVVFTLASVANVVGFMWLTAWRNED